ncbi:hypothetical protein [Mycobacterium sp. UM_CSW]|uniref:hypothetical protein n=1 Tax=Mycobacterium sp. UM_CSW TaxID=1370119 RepID=UPI00041B8D41|nr:hypothetical protein [Mycobacterium sp. UM_CSW]
MPEQERRGALINELKIVRKTGLHRLRERIDELPELSKLATATMGAGSADDIERMLRHAFTSYAEGAQGTAIGILFGLEIGRRGARPSVLREVAAKRLGYDSVETFRKRPEYNAIAYFADLLHRLAVDANSQKPADVNKIDHIMSLITELTIPEYWELTRRVRQLFAAGSQMS